jgi:hypothetical protein
VSSASPAKKSTAKRTRKPKPVVLAEFPGWYKEIKFSSGERAQTFVVLAVDPMHDAEVQPLIGSKDLMLNITISQFQP